MAGKLRLLFWIGIVLLFIPYLGITEGIKTILTIASGLALIFVAFKLKHAYKEIKYRLRRYEEPASQTAPSINNV